MNKAAAFFKRFKRDERAILPILVTAGVTLAFFPLIYWVLSLFLDGIATSIFGDGATYGSLYTFTGTTAAAWTLVKAIIAALPFAVLLIVLSWSAVNAKAKSYEN